MYKILLLNGPNLNLLGIREPEIYGTITLKDIEETVKQRGAAIGVEVRAAQHNSEGAMVDAIHDALRWASGIILNAGAYTHYSIAIRDAIASVRVPTVEVHITNVHAREPFRHRSVLAPVTIGQVVGFGIYGYIMALDGLVHYLNDTSAARIE
ncbi:MAG TPA: type II 3-dehydroquinate dehydratase [Firmicutes bacterium]|nr:type II 3-dehydroquinate dehydratase [Bacillota bacterium]